MYILISNPPSNAVMNLRFRFVREHTYHLHQFYEWVVVSGGPDSEVIHFHCIVNGSPIRLQRDHWSTFLHLLGVKFEVACQ